MREWRSTLGVRVTVVSNGSAGNPRSSGASWAKSNPTVFVRDPIRRSSSAAS